VRRESVDLFIGQINAAVDTIALDALDDQLAPHLIAKFAVAHTVLRQRLRELCELHVVLLRNPLDRIGEGLVVDAHTCALAHLQLDVFHDQTFKHLIEQHVVGGMGMLAACICLRTVAIRSPARGARRRRRRSRRRSQISGVDSNPPTPTARQNILEPHQNSSAA
jgi:hypothetical protein